MLARKTILHPVTCFIFFIAGFGLFNCQPEEEIIDRDYSSGLRFSMDSVLFDTVFTGVGSTTKRLMVYNPNAKAVVIKNIQLGEGPSSPFQILVNGLAPEPGDEVEILGKDSLLILITVNINPQDENSPYLVNDSIVMETNGILQDVQLVAWGQDANYLGNVILACNSTWTNDRPYVLYAPVLVDSLCQLNIQEGTEIYVAHGATLFVKGKIIAEGSADERILFRNDRLDPAYENIPGQWGGIYFLEGSHGNSMDFTTIRNAEIGLRLGTPDQDTIPDIVVKNTIIENMSNSGILAFTSDLYAENLLINNCMEFNCGNVAGGNYTYLHCTFANYGTDFVRESPSFFISDNIVLEDNSVITGDTYLEIRNSIIDGNMEDELFFDYSGNATNILAMSDNILRTTIMDLDTFGNILNADPKFITPSMYNYRLDTLSPAKDQGDFVGVEYDLDGNQRDAMPDIGAYERIE